ncbi:SDR family NAD(P)-dependent oxidoreductase [Desertihabitans brevis]|uniref:SDR family NAD(P)-dependent oxidoreductase n=1 Tax=Desertihabitans brevis TaxID=2268447 RepID=A0A367YRQ0_9ACTN|nr:SDR family oxidoreductase [Desertihabitans brevis]RCK68498.1 SDR family NAD(P)-dependent oxidoreductase [Desertihabitans brevis]
MPAALLTGVGRRRGIGAGIAAGLAEDGWDLALSYWTPYDQRLALPGDADDPASLAAELRDAHGVRVELVPADLADPSVPAEVVATARERLGPLDALVMAHCESVDSGLLDTTVESFDRHYAVNVRATWLLLAEFARQLPATGGAVVALTSDHTVHNLPCGATKGALDRLVLAAAHELADRGLRSNVINPGPVDTGWMDDAVHASALAQQPTGRLGTPEDTANLIRFLLSERGAWINGQLLYSNGGFPAGHLPV